MENTSIRLSVDRADLVSHLVVLDLADTDSAICLAMALGLDEEPEALLLEGYPFGLGGCPEEEHTYSVPLGLLAELGWETIRNRRFLLRCSGLPVSSARKLKRIFC